MAHSIRVLVVDDSALMRKLITQMLSASPDFEVVGQARDGYDALEKVVALKPEVVTLDIEMPNLDGMGALAEIRKMDGPPVLMLSSLTTAGAEITMRCLEMGAVDFVAKPSGSISLDITTTAQELRTKIRAAALSNLAQRKEMSKAPTPPIAPTKRDGPSSQAKLLVIGSSTGGPRALQVLVPALPKMGIPVVIVQHMPPVFTKALAERLDAASQLKVEEAVAGQVLQPDVALLAPGGFHMVFDAQNRVTLNEEPPVHGVRPSVDVTIASLVAKHGQHTIAALLTGMGRDGAVGLQAIQKSGGFTIAEHESSCTVYGMPKAAVELGAVDRVAPIEQIAAEIRRVTGGGTAARFPRSA